MSYARLGEARQAIKFYLQDLIITRDSEDKRGEAIALGNLGTAHKNLGELNAAIECLEEALKIDRK